MDGFSRAFFLSLMAHALGLVLIFAKAQLFPSESLIYQSAIKVDIVDLPDKLPDAPPVPAAPEKEESAPKPEEVAEKKPTPKPKEEAIALKKAPDKTNKQAEALNKLKQLSAFEKLNQVKNTSPKKQIRGEAISKGSSLTGLARLEHEEYLGSLDAHIRQKWFLPQYLRGKNLTAEVLVQISVNGQATSIRLIKSSGNSTFDDLAVRTVQNSSPVPRPPEKFVRILENEGFVIRFSE